MGKKNKYFNNTDLMKAIVTQKSRPIKKLSFELY